MSQPKLPTMPGPSVGSGNHIRGHVRTGSLDSPITRSINPEIRDIVRHIKSKAQEARRLGLHWTGYYYKDPQVK